MPTDRRSRDCRPDGRLASRACPSRVPAYQRLGVDERRRRLLELGADLFTRHSYAELSMSAIAREAGISKALLYLDYFPSKQAFFVATLEQGVGELAGLLAPYLSLPPVEQLTTGARRVPRLGRGACGGVRGVPGGRPPPTRRCAKWSIGSAGARPTRSSPGSTPGEAPPPALRAAVHGWLWFMDGVLLDWTRAPRPGAAAAAGPAARHPAGRRDGLRDARADRALAVSPEQVVQAGDGCLSPDACVSAVMVVGE